jgi:hypothetical protein
MLERDGGKALKRAARNEPNAVDMGQKDTARYRRGDAA